MAKKVFTDESLSTLVSEIKGYTDEAVSTKADSGHSHNAASTSAAGFMSKDDKTKLNGIATGAEVNQNAFSNVVVGSTTISADSKTDSLTIAAGTGISVSGDATNDKVTITNSGVRSISTGTANGTISVNTNGSSANVAVKGLGSAAYTASTAYDAAGTAQTKADAALASAKSYTDGKIDEIDEGFTNVITQMYGDDMENPQTIRAIATEEAAAVKNDLLNGAGSAYDTLKELGDLIDVNVDAIDALETVAASKANASDLTSHTGNKSNPHGVTLAQLGVTATAAELNIMDGVTATAAEINKLDGVTATTAELNYVDGVTSNIQTQLDAKQATVTGAATTITGSNLTASRALISNSSGKVAVSTVTSTELGYLDGVTNPIQAQLDTKATTGYVNDLTDGILTALELHATDGHAPSNAEKNQNAFSNVTVGSTTIAADTTTDTLTLVAGSNVTITPDATNDKITIAATNTTYTNVKLGHGYATCSTAEATTAKVGTLSSYTLTTGGIVAVKFTYAVPASATLNINSKGAKAIYHRGAAIKAGVIKAGDLATFIYNGSQYHLLSVDRDDNTTYSAATTSAAGLMSAADKTKLDGIATGANAYSHPTYTAKSSGLYKVTVDSTGHVSAATAVAKADITGLGIPAQDTTYSAATQSAAGLMPAADKAKVDGLLTPITTAGTGSAYTATVAGITALTKGVSFVMVPHVVSASTSPTLNVNSLGAKSIKRRLSTLATSVQNGYNAAWLAANQPFRMTYDGSYWIAEGMNQPVAADLYGTVSIAKGGTGATTAADALTALGAFPNQGYFSGDYNNLTDGVWKVKANCTNGPNAPAAVVLHKTWDVNFAVQLAFDSVEDTYYRYKLAGTWQTWKKLVSMEGNRLTERVNANIDVQATLANLTLRNIYAKTTDMTAGSTPLQTGMICLIYE